MSETACRPSGSSYSRAFARCLGALPSTRTREFLALPYFR